MTQNVPLIQEQETVSHQESDKKAGITNVCHAAHTVLEMTKQTSLSTGNGTKQIN